MKAEKIKEIYEKYPKAIAKFEEHVRSQMNVDTGGDKELEKVKTVALTQTTSAIKVMLQAWDRVLYEFFDEQQLFISVTPIDDGSLYYWKVKYKQGLNKVVPVAIGSGGSSPQTRKDAEEAAFVSAFELLEGVL